MCLCVSEEVSQGRFWRHLGFPNGSKRTIFGIRRGKVQNSKIAVSPFVSLMILEVGGHWKSIRTGSSGYGNWCKMAGGPKTCILEAKNAVLGPIMASPNLPKWNYGGLQGPWHGLIQSRPDTDGSNIFGLGLPKID